MKRSMAAVKNLIWLIAIGLSLAIMAVALVIAAFTRYEGPIQRGGPALGEEEPAVIAEQGPSTVLVGDGQLHMLTKTDDGGQAYLDRLTLLVDSNLIGLRSYRILEEMSASAQVWGSASEDIPADSLDGIALSFSDGSSLSPAQAVIARRPQILVISVGSDSLVGVSQERFTEGYKELIRSIREADPALPIVCCSISSVTVGYSGPSGLTPNDVRNANQWIQQICTDTGVYYCDAASAVDDSAGWLMEDYASLNGKALNSAGVQKVLEYLCNHRIP